MGKILTRGMDYIFAQSISNRYVQTWVKIAESLNKIYG